MEISTDNTNRHFKGQMKTEEVLCFCRRHWIVIFPHILALFLGLGVITAAYLISRSDGFRETLGKNLFQIGATIFIFISTYLIHYFFFRIFNYYLQITIITNYRVIDLDKTLFFRDDRDTIDISEIQDMTMSQRGVLQTILDYGEVTIILSSAREPKRLLYMPNPEYHFRKINKTKREYIQKRQFEKGIVMDRQQGSLMQQNLGQSIPEGLKDENILKENRIL